MCEEFVNISRNYGYTTRNLLEYLCHQNNNKLIDINLSRQANTTTPQQINFTRKLAVNNSATTFLKIH